MQTIQVGLGDRTYPIFIEKGCLAGIGPDLRERKVAKRYAVVADDRVAALYGGRVLESLSGAGLAAELVTFPAGEAQKHLATVAALASSLAAKGFDRKDGIVALGGGVSGDIAGFLAAIYMRGIPFVQVPTTLLAQVDSSVGGKTGVDIPEGKNLVGCFYQPKAVYIDTQVLATLPAGEILNGLAEVVKYGVIRDEALFDFLETRRTDILALDDAAVEAIVARSCAIKAEVVAADEREGDLRRILNFGHTIGHAVEAASRYELNHGLAVAIGMVAVARIAVAKGLFPAAAAERLQNLIAAYGMPVAIPPHLNRDEIIGFLATDKKTVGGRPFFVLPTAIGRVTITDDVSSAHLHAAFAPQPPPAGVA